MNQITKVSAIITNTTPVWVPEFTDFFNKVSDIINANRGTCKVSYTVGKKFIKIIVDNSVWGFISLYSGEYDKAPVKSGDLLKPAGFNRPARHSRGNIIDGTASYCAYGPNYLK